MKDTEKFLAWKLAKVTEQRDELSAMLARYIGAYPAFRMKPIGAPGSEKRIEQEHLMALEEAAVALIKKVHS